MGVINRRCIRRFFFGWNSMILRMIPYAACALFGSAQAQTVLTMDNPARPVVEGRQLAISVQAFAGNDMVPLRRFEDNPWPLDYRARGGTNLAIGGLRLETAMAVGAWRLGYLYRQDWLLKGNRDTVHAYALFKRNQLDTAARDFDLDYEITGFSADGIRLGRTWDWRQEGEGGWMLGVAGSLLRGRDVRHERAHGDVISALGSARLSGSRVLHHSGLRAVPAAQARGFNDFSPPVPEEVDRGIGYALDVGLHYDAGNGVHFALVANDLAGHMEWNRLPVIEQQINGLGTPYVPGVSPAVSGRNGYESLRVRLKPKWMAQAAISRDTIDAELSVQAMAGSLFPSLVVSHASAGGWRVGMSYEHRFGTLGVHLRHGNLFLSLASDRLDIADSKALAVTAGVGFDL